MKRASPAELGPASRWATLALEPGGVSYLATRTKVEKPKPGPAAK